MIIGFGGISTEKRQVNVEEHFEEVFNDAGRLFMLSKREFEHVEDGLTFKYKYLIRALDYIEATGEEDEPVVVELMLVPSYESLCDAEKDVVASCMDWEDNDISSESKYMDIAEYGCAVTMEYESIYQAGEDRYDLMKLPEVLEVIENIVVVYEAIDSLRGLYLDRPWNLIGTNGWDTLKSGVNNEDLFKRCM